MCVLIGHLVSALPSGRKANGNKGIIMSVAWDWANDATPSDGTTSRKKIFDELGDYV